MYKVLLEHKDYLPEGWTFERIENLLKDKALPLTKENLALIVNEEYLNMDIEALYQHILERRK